MSNLNEPPKIEIDLDAYVQTLTAQRNQAMDTVAQQQGLISRQQKRIAELEQQAADRQPVTPGTKPHLVEDGAA